MAEHPFKAILDQVTADQQLRNEITTLNQRYQRTATTVAEVNVLEDGDLTYGNVADIILTGINGRAGLPEQTVRVEYLRNDQKLIIPAALGMSWLAAADDRAFVPSNNQLRARYLKVATMTYQDLTDMMDDAANAAAVRQLVDALETVERAERYVVWSETNWLTQEGTVDRNQSDILFTLVSKALQFNCDIRDYGYLLTAEGTLQDATWDNEATLTQARLRIKLHPYTMQSIAALNMQPCGEYALGAWVRAYGLAFGMYPAKGSQTMDESTFTTRMPTAANLGLVRQFERSYQDLLVPICGNVLAIFGLLHLNKDHTFRSGDATMDRVGTSFLQTLRTSATTQMLETMGTNKEVILRTAAHPFGLGQTYWLARAMFRTHRLMPALAIRIDTAPPPVQRILIVHAAVAEWTGMPIGNAINEAFQPTIQSIADFVATIKASPPSFSDLHRLYGIPAKTATPDTVKNAANAMMPIVYGFAMTCHCDDAQKKDGLALAMSMDNVVRDAKGMAMMWKGAWENYQDRLDRYGIEGFVTSYRDQVLAAGQQ